MKAMKFYEAVVLVVLLLMSALGASAADAEAEIHQFDAQVTDNGVQAANLANIANPEITIDGINSINQVKQGDILNKQMDNNLENIIKSGSGANLGDDSNLNGYKDLKNKIANVFSQLILTASGDDTKITNLPEFSFDKIYKNDINMDFTLLINQGVESPADQIKTIQFDIPTPAEVNIIETGKDKST
jgi:hypothetical protein